MPDYRSPFDFPDYDPDLHIPFDSDLHFYSEKLTPLCQCDEIRQAIPPSRLEELKIHQLYSYLHFTVRLETEPVNEIAQLLSRPNFLPWIDPQRRADALHVYRDEGKHADWSNQIIERVEQETGITRLAIEPAFLDQLNELMAGEDESIADFVKLFFVIVSETLITGSLNRLPKDKTVQVSVRNIAKAHAADEGRHHIFFKSLFGELWPLIPQQLRVRLGTLLPAMLKAFLSPDRGYLVGVLETFQEITEPVQVVDKILTSADTVSGMRTAAMPSLRMFRDAGVFEEPVVADAFARNGFWLDKAEDST